MYRAFTLVVALSIALLGGGCNKPPPSDDGTAAAAPTGPAPAVPSDHIENGSLAPGKEKAFALVLPLGFSRPIAVEHSAATTGMAPAKQVTKYISERVRDGKLLESKTDDNAVFEGVRIPDDPTRYLKIVVTSKGPASTLVVVTDITPPEALPPVSEAERYKQVGMDPRGHLLHPRTIE